MYRVVLCATQNKQNKTLLKQIKLKQNKTKLEKQKSNQAWPNQTQKNLFWQLDGRQWKSKRTCDLLSSTKTQAPKGAPIIICWHSNDSKEVKA